MKNFTKLYYLPIILAKTVITTDEQYSKTKSEILKTIKLLVILLILTSSITYSQNLENKIDKYFFDNNKELGGECILKNSRVSIDGNIISKTFEFEVPVSGNYYMSAWIMGAETKNGLQEYNVTLDNLDTIAGKIIMTKTGWQTANLSNMVDKLKSQSSYLTEGKHSISIQCEQPDVPEVEFIRLSRNEELSVISDLRYRSYLDSIKQICLNRNQSLWEKKDTLSPDSKTELPNPEGDYDHQVNISFGYTTYKRIYLYSGTFVIISTYASDYYDHVLEVFNEVYTENYSWVSKSYNGVARIRMYIGYSGYYYIRIRAYRQGTYGLADLDILVNGAPYLHYDDCPVTGNGFRCYHTSTSEYNYFTCKLTGDSRIWIEQGYGIPGKIIAYNDNYGYHGGDFPWGNASRVKKSFSTPVGATLISSYSSYNPTGYCDVYMKCGNSTVADYFDNFEADDAIRSADTNSYYNCASWGGGRVDLGRYFWASNPPYSKNLSGDWYVSGNFWASWNNYFGNNPERFTGAPDYTTSGATASNAEIAMWGPNSNPYNFGHVSITKPGNNQPHGYDWESKPGELMRTFHPRDAVGGSDGYGSIQVYWRRTNPNLKSYSLKESVALGLTILPEIVLNHNEKDKIETLKKQLLAPDKNDFRFKFISLVEKSHSPEFLIQSNPVYLHETEEFNDLLKYFEEEGKKLWPLLFEKVFDESTDESSELAAILVNEVTPEYSSFMEQVKTEWRNNCYTKGGAYIAPSPMNNTKNYIKKLLNIYNEKTGEIKNIIMSKYEQVGYYDNFEIFSLYPNPFKYRTNIKFNLKAQSEISLKIYDINGKIVSIILNNERKDIGNHTIEWIPENLTTGIYICKLIVGKNEYYRRFLIEK